jgi:hypothetical protein
MDNKAYVKPDVTDIPLQSADPIAMLFNAALYNNSYTPGSTTDINPPTTP